MLTEPTAANTCGQEQGAIEEGRYPAAAVPGEVPYLIYLPPCYPEHAKSYPVLYLLHGYPYDERHWIELGAANQADTAIRAGEWPPFLMVMPLQPEPLFRNSDGGPGSYESEMLEGLAPHVDLVYRSDPSRRGIAGVSRGGVWALEIAFRNPSVFPTVAALSPALAVNAARPPYDPFEIVKAAGALPQQILLVAGDQDWAAVETRRLSQALSENGVEHSFLIVPGAHANATWASVMAQVLEFFGRAWSAGP